MHLLFSIITYANLNITNEYIKKLEQIDQFIKDNRENNKSASASLMDASKSEEEKSLSKRMNSSIKKSAINGNQPIGVIMEEGNSDD